jgi:CRISPR/Cas system-associated exonuclease Cas4 (RecB family)
MPVHGKRSKNLFDPHSDEPFKLSRSKIESFIECPRCFYLDRRLGIGRPSMPGFTLNDAVDKLLKKEFDIHRVKRSRHPLMETYGVDAIPFAHEMMDEWRENFKGVQYYDRGNNFIITGAVDDIWVDHAGKLIVVDYKATSTREEITLDSEYRQAYKRQMEIYQWLLRQNGFEVSDTGYFVYANGNKDKEAFDGRLEFIVKLIAYTGSDTWVPKALTAARKCLSGELPEVGTHCEYCDYRSACSPIEIES